ncbi:unnamed protein product [Arctogadus glacialis]
MPLVSHETRNDGAMQAVSIEGTWRLAPTSQSGNTLCVSPSVCPGDLQCLLYNPANRTSSSSFAVAVSLLSAVA